MLKDVVVEPMTEEFILWRCLHDGPLSRDTIDQWPPAYKLLLERWRERNTPLLVKFTRTYGACAIIARDGDEIVGMLRFYPKALCGLEGAGYLCFSRISQKALPTSLPTATFQPLHRYKTRHFLFIA